MRQRRKDRCEGGRLAPDGPGSQLLQEGEVPGKEHRGGPVGMRRVSQAAGRELRHADYLPNRTDAAEESVAAPGSFSWHIRHMDDPAECDSEGGVTRTEGAGP